MMNHNGDDQSHNIPPEQLTAYALGQLHGDELAAVKAKLASAGEEAALSEVRAMQAAAAEISAAREAEPLPAGSASLHELVHQRLLETAPKEASASPVTLPESHSRWRRPTKVEWTAIAGVLCACCLIGLMLLPAGVSSRNRWGNRVQAERTTVEAISGAPRQNHGDFASAAEPQELASALATAANNAEIEAALPTRQQIIESTTKPGEFREYAYQQDRMLTKRTAEEIRDLYAANPVPTGDVPHFDPAARPPTPPYFTQPKAPVVGRNFAPGSPQSGDGGYDGAPGMPARGIGYSAGRPARAKGPGDSGGMIAGGGQYPRPNISGFPMPGDVGLSTATEAEVARRGGRALSRAELTELDELRRPSGGMWSSREQYAPILENRFVTPLEQPLSTFSIDVDTASYANMRRFLTSGRLPPPDSVRIEELVNYFRYDYPQPKDQAPFSVNMEVAECPWREGHWLLRVGLHGREVERTQRPASNLVFLLDVSGSMADANKLPLLKTAMQMLVRELGENDRVAIVTYAGEAGLKLPSTGGHEQARILAAIEALHAGGSTNGSAGIELAYHQAAAHFIPDGANRVILCTDGDLNVGVTSDEALVQLIKQKAAGGTFLTVLGFGEGNLQDAKLEKLADNGNGVYAYIDSLREARKVLVEQLTGSTITIAKDVKIQIEFNPREVASYRLLGYENRVLAAEDFNNDQKDAGEIGAGHTVTALYELTPARSTAAGRDASAVDPLKYQGTGASGQQPGDRDQQSEKSPDSRLPTSDSRHAGELLTLKLRYKEPDGDTSKLLEYPLKDRGRSFHSASPDLQFAAAVASFGMILRGSAHRGAGNLAAVEEIASASLGDDAGGYRAGFVDLVRKARALGAN